ncbi:MAG TPA: efflux RND transporter periplasmic adaptor subunit [Polyangiaceae bacterium]|nr:efflux RND transporter periplasmic adaptor subunit [Polyangiaceae bacterium]
MNARWTVAAIAAHYFLVSCKTETRDTRPPPEASSVAAAPDAGGHEHTDEPAHEELPKRVRLSKDVIADAKIRTAPVVKENLAATLTLPGEIAADPDKSARVSVLVPGRLMRVDFKEGSVVRKGQVLVTIRIPEIGKVRSAYKATIAKAAAARANADRVKILADKGLGSAQEAHAARAEAESLEAEAKGLADQLGALGMSVQSAGSELAVRAPVNGIVVSRDAIVGQPVTADETIAAIADLSEVLFLGRVFEMDLGRLQTGARAEVQLNAYPKERFAGVIEYLGRQIDPVARTVTARIRLTNRNDLLRIGLFGTAQVSTAEEQRRGPVLVVPRTALTEIGGKSFVFVRHADDDFEIHEVVLGESALGKVEIVSGLREGEQVVVDGVFTLKSAVLKSALTEDE